MDESKKKKIIAGAAILVGAALAYALNQRRPTPPPTYICPYCGETFANYAELQAHIQAEHPTEPPVQEFGYFRGFVLDSSTGSIIRDAKIYVDNNFDSLSDQNGIYQTNYFTYGLHTISVEANNYQKASFEVTLGEALMTLHLQLTPLEEAPTEWTEGITVQKITITPTIAYVGETVFINVYIDYPYPLPSLPVNIHGSVLVNGEKLTGNWILSTYQTVFEFGYPTTHTGDFTVKTQNKSASFTVVEAPITTYYSPFGGVRMPLCTDILILNVPPLGSNIKYSDLPLYTGQKSYFFLPQWPSGYASIEVPLSGAQPIAWNPSDAVVTKWEKSYWRVEALGAGLLVMATEYTCKEYWDSKDELARMIAGYMDESIKEFAPDIWKLKYGKFDLSRGLRDWTKEIVWRASTYGGGPWALVTLCPYCDAEILGPHLSIGHNRIDVARKLLEHIETNHPNHPLTEPAWF